MENQDIAQLHQLLQSNDERNFDLVIQLLSGMNIVPDKELSIQLTKDGDKIRACLKSGLKEQITAMDWSGCRLTTLPPYSTQFTNLRYLGLSDNYFGTLPANMAAFEQLEILDLDSNQFKKFPTVLAELTTLQELYIQGSQLQHFGDAQPIWKDIQFLDLSRNILQSLPDSATQWESLRCLKLRRNNLKYLPEGVETTWCKLEELNLAWNLLQPSTLEKIVQLSGLRILSLCNNNVKALPKGIENWQQLETLDVSFNPAIATLPTELFQLPNLRQIDIRGNSIPRQQLDAWIEAYPHISILYRA